MAVFDATGTLIEVAEPVGEVYHRVALDHGVDLPAWRLDDAFRRVVKNAPPRGIDGADEAARRAGEFEWWRERIRQTFQATDSTARFEDFDAFARALFETYRAEGAWRARAGVPELLRALADVDHPMAIASNFDHRLPDVLEALDLLHFFDAIALPSIVGASKSEASFLHWLTEHTGMATECMRYVGDDAPDVLDALRDRGVAVLDVRSTPDPRDWRAFLAHGSVHGASR